MTKSDRSTVASSFASVGYWFHLEMVVPSPGSQFGEASQDYDIQ